MYFFIPVTLVTKKLWAILDLFLYRLDFKLLLTLPSKNEGVLGEVEDVLETPQDSQLIKKYQISSNIL